MANIIVIKNRDWKKVYESIDNYYPPDVPKYIVDDFLDACNFLKNMKDYRDLRNYPGYDSEQKKGTWKGYYGIRFNKQWRLLFKQDRSTDPITIYIDYVDNKHYE